MIIIGILTALIATGASATICLTARFGRIRIHVIVDVFGDFVLGCETTATIRHGTAEWTVAYLVRTRVLIQNGFLSEVLAALSTLIGLLTGVYANVLIQDRTLSEESGTV